MLFKKKHQSDCELELHQGSRFSAGSFLFSKKTKRIFKISASLLLIFSVIISGIYINRRSVQGADLFPLADSYQSTPMSNANNQSNYQTTAFTSGNYTSVGTDDTDYATTTASSEPSDVFLAHSDGAENGTTFIDNSGFNKTITANGNARTLSGNPVTPSGNAQMQSGKTVTANGNARMLTGQAVSANGNAQISTTQSKFGGASSYFDGTGDYLTIPNSDDFNFGTGSFTIDWWMNVPDGGASTDPIFGRINGSSPYQGWYIDRNGSTLNFASNDNNVLLGVNNVVVQNTWQHFAYVYDGSVLKLYVDGVEKGTVTGTVQNYNTELWVARAQYTGWGESKLYLDEVRITKGQARWTSNFTVPTSAYSTDTNTKLLLHGDGTNASTNFIDSSNIGTKFGSSGAYFDGAGDYLSAPDSEDWNFGSGDFTVDFWAKRTRAGTTEYLVAQDTDSVISNFSWSVYFFSNDRVDFSTAVGSSYYAITNGTISVTDTNWHHFAMVRSGTSLYGFVDGNLSGSRNDLNALSLNNSNQPLAIGQSNYGTNHFYLNGYLDELRITKGTARWTSNFTPPTSAYLAEGGTKFLLHADGTNGSASFRDSSATKFGDSSMYFDGTGDYVSIPGSSDFDFSAGQDFTVDFWTNLNVDTTNWTGLVMAYNISPGTQGDGWAIGIDNNGYFSAYDGVGWHPTAINPITGLWYHIAWVRNGSSTDNNSLYINGSLAASWTDSTLIGNSQNLSIGSKWYNYNDFNGYIDEARITKGQARWTSNFTPPTSAYSTDANTKILLHGDGTNASTNFIDSSEIGKKFGTTGAYLDGSGDYLSITDSSDWDFGSGDFTIDFWANIKSWNASGGGIISSGINGAPEWAVDNNNWQIYQYPANTIGLVVDNSGAYPINAIMGLSLNQWYHISYVRNGNTLNAYLNGNLSNSTDVSGIAFNSTAGFGIGRQDSRGLYFNGHLDEIRITKGTARWTSNFTPPTQASSICPTTTTDSDNNTYNVVQIGNQCWTKENMKVGTMLTNGSTLPSNNSQIEKWCYDSNPANCTTYGGLYTWAEANQLDPSCNSTTCTVPENNQGICPTGFHIPTHDEFTTLERSVCTSGSCNTDFPYDTTTTGWRGTNEGSKLSSFTSGGNNSSGFSGLLAGNRGTNGSFDGQGAYTFVWSMSESPTAAYGWVRALSSSSATVYRHYANSKEGGSPVRCLKNSNPTSPLYASQFYTFDASAYSTPSTLDISLLSYATASTNGITAKIWNNSNSTFETLSNLTNTASSMPSSVSVHSITSNISNYLDNDGKVKVLIHSTNPSSGGASATLNTDYIKLGFANIPAVTTNPITGRTSIGAIGHAEITDPNGETPERMIEWGTTEGGPYPSSCTIGNGGLGVYTCDLTGLTPATTYYYRAKAVNNGGTGYGAELNFTTFPEEYTIDEPDSIKVTDVNNSEYLTIGAGTLTSTDLARTNLNLKLQTDNALATIPVNTVITRTQGGNFNASLLDMVNVSEDILASIHTSRGAIEIGVPNIGLTFSQPITVSINVDAIYNGEMFYVQSQSSGQTTWSNEGTCTITDAKCTFQTTHATTFMVNGSGPLSGELNSEVSLEVGTIISLTCDDVVNLSSITGTGQSILGANSEATCTIRTNNVAGYKLEWRSSNPNLTNPGAQTIAGFTPTTPNTPEVWSVNSADSEWGARLRSNSTDSNTTFWGAQDDYTNGKWLNVSDSAFQIISRNSNTTQTGSTEIIQFGVEVGSNKFQPSGSYSTDVIITATTL